MIKKKILTTGSARMEVAFVDIILREEYRGGSQDDALIGFCCEYDLVAVRKFNVGVIVFDLVRS